MLWHGLSVTRGLISHKFATAVRLRYLRFGGCEVRKEKYGGGQGIRVLHGLGFRVQQVQSSDSLRGSTTTATGKRAIIARIASRTVAVLFALLAGAVRMRKSFHQLLHETAPPNAASKYTCIHGHGLRVFTPQQLQSCGLRISRVNRDVKRVWATARFSSDITLCELSDAPGEGMGARTSGFL